MDSSKQPSYAKLKRPSSSRDSIWNHFGFAANSSGTILTRKEIICCLCFTPFPYPSGETKDLTELQLHMVHKHPDVSFRAHKIEVIQVAEAEAETEAAVSYSDIAMENEMVDEVMEDRYDEEEIDEQVEYLIDNAIEDEVDVEDEKPNLDKIKFLRAAQPVFDIGDVSPGLAEMCIEDLIAPEVVDGPGFARWIQKIKPKAIQPTSGLIYVRVNEFYRQKVFSEKRQLSFLFDQKRRFALAIDLWVSAKSVSNISLSVYFENDDKTGYSSIDNFESHQATTNDWTSYLHWFNLKLCTAAILNFEADDSLTEFMHQNDVPIFMCFSTIVGRIVETCFKLASVQDALETSQIHLYSNDFPLTKNFWVSKFSVLETYLGLDYVQLLIAEHEDIKQAVKLLQRLVECLTPLKMVLETVNHEKHPVASLIQPLAKQLLENYFEDEEQGWDVVNAIVQEEFYKNILSNEFLSIVSFLDPRFHSHFESDEVQIIKSKIQTMCPTDKIVFPAIPKSQIKPKPSSAAPATSGLSLFFNKSKAKPIAPDPFDVEFHKYMSISDVPLEQRPQDWWNSNGNQFPRLHLVAKKLLCSPAVLDNPIANQEFLFNRRFQFECSTVKSKMLALHSVQAKKTQ